MAAMSGSENTDDTGIMSLWLIVTGRTGESYERAYAWAETESEARDLFSARHPHSQLKQVTLLFNASDSPFATNLSDSGILDGALVEEDDAFNRSSRGLGPYFCS